MTSVVKYRGVALSMVSLLSLLGTASVRAANRPSGPILQAEHHILPEVHTLNREAAHQLRQRLRTEVATEYPALIEKMRRATSATSRSVAAAQLEQLATIHHKATRAAQLEMRFGLQPHLFATPARQEGVDAYGLIEPWPGYYAITMAVNGRPHAFWLSVTHAASDFLRKKHALIDIRRGDIHYRFPNEPTQVIPIESRQGLPWSFLHNLRVNRNTKSQFPIGIAELDHSEQNDNFHIHSLELGERSDIPSEVIVPSPVIEGALDPWMERLRHTLAAQDVDAITQAMGSPPMDGSFLTVDDLHEATRRAAADSRALWHRPDLSPAFYNAKVAGTHIADMGSRTMGTVFLSGRLQYGDLEPWVVTAAPFDFATRGKNRDGAELFVVDPLVSRNEAVPIADWVNAYNRAPVTVVQFATAAEINLPIEDYRGDNLDHALQLAGASLMSRLRRQGPSAD